MVFKCTVKLKCVNIIIISFLCFNSSKVTNTFYRQVCKNWQEKTLGKKKNFLFPLDYIPVFVSSTTTDYFGGKFGSKNNFEASTDANKYAATLFRDVVDKYPLNVIGDQTTTTSFQAEPLTETTTVRFYYFFFNFWDLLFRLSNNYFGLTLSCLHAIKVQRYISKT